MNIYVFYSGATRKTGEALVNALNSLENMSAVGGETPPEERVDMTISWGAKTNEDIKLKTKHSMNHPNNIRVNRNKYDALNILEKEGIPVGTFASADKVLAEIDKKKSEITLPMIGRRNHHQGGQGFWMCLTKYHISEAIKEGAQYFQNYVPFKTEYRMHVFKDEVFYAHKKVKHGDPKQAFVDDYLEKSKAFAAQNNQNFDEDTAKVVLGRLAERKTNANPILKSHMEGWKFTSVKKSELTNKEVKQLCDISKKAVTALNLSFAAVDCALSEDGKPYIIEVNTGPGLTGQTFDAWVDKLGNHLKSMHKNAKAPEKTETKEEKKQNNNVNETKKKKSSSGGKDSAIEQLDYLKNLINNAESDEEVATLKKVASRALASGGDAAGGDAFF